MSLRDRVTTTVAEKKRGTQAYTANEVANVYMAFERGDLEFSDADVKNLEPGFVGMSDPLNLRSVLERFTYDFNYGSNVHQYRIRLLNPTTELEDAFTSFFESLYPDNTNQSNWRRASTKEQERRDPNYIQRTKVDSLPTIYIRWGYGTKTTDGLSQIHKCRLADLEYFMNANEDKVVELLLTDLFSFTKTSLTFNNREHKAVVEWKTDDKPEGKLPGEMLQELLAKYTSIYPEIMVLTDFYTSPNDDGGSPRSYGQSIDAKVAGIAENLAKSMQQKAASNYQKAIRILDSLETKTTIENAFKDSQGPNSHGAYQPIEVRETRYETLSADSSPDEWNDFVSKLPTEVKKEIEDKLNAPADAIVEWSRVAQGVVTPSVTLQALKMFFNNINLKWSYGLEDINELLKSGVLVPTQLDEDVAPTPGNPEDKVRSEIMDAESTFYEQMPEGSLIDIVRKTPPTQLPKVAGSFQDRRLGFYPMVLGPAIEKKISNEPLADINDINLSGTLSAIDAYSDVEENVVIPDSGYLLSGIVVELSQQITNLGDSYLINYLGTGEGDSPEFTANPKRVKLFGVTTAAKQNNNPLNSDARGDDPDGFYLLNCFPEGNGSDKALLIRDIPTTYPIAQDDPILVTPYELGLSDLDVYDSNPLAQAFPPQTTSTRVNTGAKRVLRQPTPEDKAEMESAGYAPIYLNPGPVKPNFNARELRQADAFGEYSTAFEWTSEDYFSQFNRDTLDFATNTGANLPPIDVMALTPAQVDPYRPEKPSFEYARAGYTPAYEKTPNDGSVLGASPLELDRPQLFEGDLRYPVYDIDTGRMAKVIVWDEDTQTEIQNPQIPHGSPLHTWAYSASGYNYLNMPLRLEPTLDTYRYLCEVGERQTKEILEQSLDIQGPLLLPPEIKDFSLPTFETKLGRVFENQGYLTLATEGERPNIEQALNAVTNSLNSLLDDQANKLQLIQVSTASMTSEQRDFFVGDQGPLPDSLTMQQKREILDNNKLLVCLGTSDFVNAFTTFMVNDVYSFPETVQYDKQGKPMKDVVKLNYATENSIVTDLKFTGETRWAFALGQSVYMERYYGAINDYFLEESDQTNFLISTIGTLLQKSIELNKNILESNQFTQGSKNIATQNINTFQGAAGRITAKGQPGEVFRTYEVIDSDILALLPGLVASFTSTQLTDMFGAADVKKLLVLAEMCADPELFNLVFPELEMNTQNTNNNSTYNSLIGFGNTTAEVENLIMPRKIDFATAYQRMGGEEGLAVQRKMMDSKFMFAQAMLDEIWEIEIETLGIPEMDVGTTEVMERVIALWVYDTRLSTTVPHWLSGAYKIKGFSHEIDVRSGYRTKFSLYRPRLAYNNNPITPALENENAD